jgi:urea transporter
MAGIGESWTRMTGTSAVLRFVDSGLRGAGQVMLQDNPLTGLLFLLGVGWGAVSAGMPQVAIGALVGLVVATATAIYLRVDQSSLRRGIYGYNGILVGVALPTFLAAEPLLWAYLMFGAAISVVAMLTIASFMKTWHVSALTLPFVLTTWLMLLAAYAFDGLRISGLPQRGIPHAPSAASMLPLGGEATIQAVLYGVSQVFLIGNVATGVIFLVALLVNSVWAAVFALAGSMLAVAAALALGADSNAVAAGLFGFSPVLTAIALGTVFHAPQPRVVVYTAAATIFTVIVQAALNVVFLPIGIPTLTAPFVAVAWLFLVPRRDLAPVPHVRGRGGVLHHE